MAKPTIIEIDIRLKEVEKLIEYLNKIVIRGNGQTSLVEEVHSVADFVKEEKETRKFQSRAVFAAVLTNFGALIFAAYMWFAKILPAIERINALLPPK